MEGVNDSHVIIYTFDIHACHSKKHSFVIIACQSKNQHVTEGIATDVLGPLVSSWMVTVLCTGTVIKRIWESPAGTNNVYCEEVNCIFRFFSYICLFLFFLLRVKVKTESQDPTSSWRSLIPVIKVNVSTVSEFCYSYCFLG